MRAQARALCACAHMRARAHASLCGLPARDPPCLHDGRRNGALALACEVVKSSLQCLQFAMAFCNEMPARARFGARNLASECPHTDAAEKCANAYLCVRVRAPAGVCGGGLRERPGRH